jgi:hypothetical protein
MTKHMVAEVWFDDDKLSNVVIYLLARSFTVERLDDRHVGQFDIRMDSDLSVHALGDFVPDVIDPSGGLLWSFGVEPRLRAVTP